MFLLKTLSSVLEDPKVAPVMADWLEEFAFDKPEVHAYIARLRNWTRLRLTTLLETVVKFGTKQERSLIRKLTKTSFLKHHGRRKQRKEMRKNSLTSSNAQFQHNLKACIDTV